MWKQRYIFCMILLAGCNFSRSYNNDNIDPQTKETIDHLNRQIVEGLESNNPEKVLLVCSPKLLAISKNDVHSLIQQMHYEVDSFEYEPGMQFLVRNSSTEAVSSAVSGLTGEHDYKITFKAITKESIVAVGVLNSAVRTFALTCIYGKYQNQWKLNIMRIGELRMLDKDAFDWYLMAKTDFDKGYLADAGCKYAICERLMKPAPEWQYQKTQEVIAFGDKLKQQINRSFTFPIKKTLSNAVVSIFYVNPEILNEGYFPLVSYVSLIPVSDSLKLSKECDSLSAVIDNIFPGLSNNKGIIYRAYNKIPTSGNNQRYYTFVRWKK